MQADTWALWDDDTDLDTPFFHDPSFLTTAFENHAAGKYIDVNCWVFTPWHVFSLVGQIDQSTGLGFDLGHLLTTQDHDLECYVQLVRTDSPTPIHQQITSTAPFGGPLAHSIDGSSRTRSTASHRVWSRSVGRAKLATWRTARTNPPR